MDLVGGVDLTHAQIREHLAKNNYFAKRGIRDWKKIDAKSAVFREVVADYQQFQGIPVDEKPGPVTQYQMSLPRCGMPDMMLEAGAMPAWPKSCMNITTSHQLSTLGGLDAQTFHAGWMNALDEVRRVCGLNPTFIQDINGAQCWALPGRMNRATLAYAYPTNGDCGEKLESRYNDKITWDARQFRSTCLHEMCHWWGLGHGPPGSLMAPTDDPSIDGVLDQWTIDELVKRYGRRVAPLPPQAPPTVGSIAIACEFNGRKFAGVAHPV